MGILTPLVDDFWTYSVTGVVQGAVYALVALGYALVYGVLRLINFAHSEVFMVGTFAAVLAVRVTGLGPDERAPGAAALAGYLALAMLAAATASGATAVVVERVAYRPLRRGDASVPVILLGGAGLPFAVSRTGIPGIGRPAAVPLAAALLAAVGVARAVRAVSVRSRGRPPGTGAVLAITAGSALAVLAAVLAVRGAVLDDGRAADRATWTASLAAAAVLAAVLVAALGWEERTRGRRGGAPTLVFLISAIGASFVLSEIFGLWQGRNNVRVGNLMEPRPVLETAAVRIDTRQVLVVVAAVAMMLALDAFMQRTRLGRGVRAVAQNPDVAALMGVNADRVITLTFLLGGLMAGVAAVLYDLQFGVTRYDAGFLLGIKAFTAAVLGGIGNLRGALLGGLLLGLAESWGSAVAGAEWRDVVAFVFLVLVLMFRPTGILGESLGRARA